MSTVKPTGNHTGKTPGATSKVESAREAVSTAVDELITQLESGKSEHLLSYLSTMSRFHSYSFGNIMLIMGQCPQATRVAGFHTWKSMGRSVMKDQKGIVIIAPMVLKPTEQQTFSKGFEGEGRRVSVDGKDLIVRFRAVNVFDISQTDGDPFPEPDRISGEPGTALAQLESAIESSGITLETVESLNGADGVSIGGTIKVIDSLSTPVRFSVLAHEWAHELLHKVSKDDRPPKTVRETEAESVAFVVSHAFGLETGSASSDYIQLYNGDKDTLTASLDRIQKTACIIIDAIRKQDDLSNSITPTLPPTPTEQPNKHEIDPDRLARGTYCHTQKRTIGEGNISASYSADKICFTGSVRNPFRWNGSDWVNVGYSVRKGHTIYKLVDPSVFSRTMTTYAKKTHDCEAARQDPFGFYDGMQVTRGKQAYVLCGPPVIVKPGKPTQGELFAHQVDQNTATR